MDDALQKAFDFAQDVTKQVLTLATGIIALTITFFQNFAVKAPDGAKTLMAWSWVLYIASVFFGLWTLLALTGTLQPLRASTKAPSINGWNVRIPALAQLALFVAGLIVSVIAGIKALKGLS